MPVLVAADGEVIAGHGRILAATELGLTEAPVIVLGHLTEAQRRAYRIADNKLTELGGYDEALLAAELKELLADEFDLSLTGIEDDELDRLLRGWRPAAPLDEAVANGVVGYGVAVLTQLVVFPWFGLPARVGDALAIGAIFSLRPQHGDDEPAARRFSAGVVCQPCASQQEASAGS